MSKKNLFLTMSRPYILVTLLLLAILTLLTAYIIYACHSKNPGQTNLQAMKRIKSIQSAAIILAIIVTITATAAVNLVLAGIQHGVYDPNTSLFTILTKLPNTPKESNIDKTANLSNAYLIFFKFGCSDCEAVYQDLKLAIDGQSDIYWVSTHSVQGKLLLNKYPVSETPSMVYIYPNNNKFAVFRLHTKNTNGSIILDRTMLKRALAMRQ